MVRNEVPLVQHVQGNFARVYILLPLRLRTVDTITSTVVSHVKTIGLPLRLHLTIIELTMWPSGRVCGNRLLERLMSPSPKSQVMFASAFS